MDEEKIMLLLFLFACEKCAMRKRNDPNALCAKQVEAGSESRRATVWAESLLSKKNAQVAGGGQPALRRVKRERSFSMSRVALYGKNYSK